MSGSLVLINSNDKNAFAALYKEDGIIVSAASEFIEDEGLSNKKPDKLINCVHKISQQNNFKNISAIAVTTGPGSFTGIRVGLAIAKGMAYALDKKLIVINNFELTLNRAGEPAAGTPYLVLIPAKLPEYYYSIIVNGITKAQGCVLPGNIAEIAGNDTIIVGDFDDETSIKHSYFKYINVKNLKSEQDSMLELAKKALAEGSLYNAEDVEPLYLKDFIIKSK